MQVPPTPGPSPAAPDPAHLPTWFLRLQQIDLAGLLAQAVRITPVALGFRHASIYLSDSELQVLRLARSTLKRSAEAVVDLADADHPLAAAARGSGPVTCDSRIWLPLHSDHELQGVLELEQPCRDEPPSPALLAALGGYLGRQLAHAQAFERVRLEGRVDCLTGLHNLRWFRETLEHEMQRARRFGSPLSLLAIDLDGLKRTNDVHGHLAGDARLRHVARQIVRCLRNIDSAARIGGDEFAVILPRTNLAGAQRVAQRVLRVIRRDRPAGESGASTGASIGACEWREGWSAERFFQLADLAMYQAKRDGGGRTCVHCPDETPER